MSPIADKDASTIRHMIREEVGAHAAEMPHHKPPCPYFSSHRALILWVVPAVCAVAAFLFGVAQWQASALGATVHEQTVTTDRLKIEFAVMQNDLTYIKQAVGDIRDAVRKDRPYPVP